MNKVKMFFVAAALVLTTAGVFAGKARFASFHLYAVDESTTPYTKFELTPASTTVNTLTTTIGTNPALIQSNANPSTPYYIENVNGTTFQKLYTTF